MRRFKLISSIVVVTFLISLLAACTAPAAIPTVAPTEGPVVITDALGRTVEFAELPQRIVLIGKGTTLLANSAFMFPEAQEKIISYELRLQMKDRNFIETIFTGTQEMTLLEKDAGAEQIAPLNPDLVIMKTYMQEKLGTTIEALGLNVVYLDLETPEQFYKDIRTLGQIFGNDSRAEEIVALYQANEARISDALVGITDTDIPSVLLLQYSDKGGEVAFSVPPIEWLQSMLVQNAGGDPVWKDATTDGGWTVVTLEQIATWNPDMIFVIDYSGKAVEIVANLKTDANWQAMTAVVDEKIYAFPVDFLSWDQADPRWSLGELWLASKIHPDKIGSLNMQDEITNFYKSYYALDEAVITEKVMPLVSGDL
jgi:iron complex transport system substrate-binding protein